MKLNQKKVLAILTVAFLILTTNSQADNIDEALKEAYQNGYNVGYLDGKNSVGGTSGREVGFSVFNGGGGSTSGYEVPGTFRLDNSNKIIQYLDKNKSIESLIKFQKNEGAKTILEQHGRYE